MWTGEGESKILYVQTHGVNDPGRSATPFFLAASAAAMDAEVMIYSTMYGPTLLQSDVVDKIGPKGDRGQPLSYFIDQATALGVRLLVCRLVARPERHRAGGPDRWRGDDRCGGLQ